MAISRSIPSPLKVEIDEVLRTTITDQNRLNQARGALNQAFDANDSKRYYMATMNMDGKIRQGKFIDLVGFLGAADAGDVFIPDSREGGERVIVLTGDQARTFNNGSLSILSKRPDDGGVGFDPMPLGVMFHEI